MPYFHVVFTVPSQIEVIAFQNQTVVYDILFRAASETLRTIAADPEHLGAEIGFLGVLHTWGQNLLHHPHIHFLVPGGGIAPDGQSWIACRPGFFLPVQVLSRMFRGLFLGYLEKAFAAGALSFFSEHRHLHEPAAFRRYLTPAWKTEWVVYAKPPFAGPAQVLDYVGRYTHRVAISNNRLVSMDDGKVCFRWKDYRDDNRQKTMTLPAEEFIRRFLIHVLPDGFHRIRYFGFLGNWYPFGEDRGGPCRRSRSVTGIALQDCRIGFMHLDELFEVFDPEARKAGRALIVDAIDSHAPRFGIHFKRDIRQPVLVLAQHRRDTGYGEYSTRGRHDQAASSRSRACQDHGSNSSSLWAG